jgi:hypothetical protein
LLFHLAGSAPNNTAEAYKLFRSFFYITHMQQARCYEAAINYWRRLRSQPAGLTMGVLYWQLNDIAAFASWSGYDYEGACCACVVWRSVFLTYLFSTCLSFATNFVHRMD